MSPKNKLITEWIAHGGWIEYEDKRGIVIKKDDELLILYNGFTIHIAPGFIAVKIGGHWRVSYAPSWRGRAKEIVKEVLYKYLPKYYHLVQS